VPDNVASGTNCERIKAFVLNLAHRSSLSPANLQCLRRSVFQLAAPLRCATQSELLSGLARGGIGNQASFEIVAQRPVVQVWALGLLGLPHPPDSVRAVALALARREEPWP